MHPYRGAAYARKRLLAGPWVQDNVAASQSAVALKVAAAANTGTEEAATRAGFISGISATFTVAPAGSTLVLTVTKNGSAISGCVLSVTAGATLGRATTFSPGIYGVAAGDRIGVTVTTDGSWTAITSDMVVNVEIETAP